MFDFSPIVVLLLIWVLIGFPLARAAKKQAGKGSARRTPAAPKDGQPAEGEAAPAPADLPAGKTQEGPRPVFGSTLRPTIAPGQHDDSLYRGSLNAVTGEGYDPCHDEQLEGLRAAETEPAPVSAPRSVPGLQLSWAPADVVRGVVMSEILNRKPPLR